MPAAGKLSLEYGKAYIQQIEILHYIDFVRKKRWSEQYLLCKLWLYSTLELHPSDQHVLHITIIHFFGKIKPFFTNFTSSDTWQLMRLIQHFYLNVTINHYWVSVRTSDWDPMWILGEDIRKIHSYNFCGGWRKTNVTSSVTNYRWRKVISKVTILHLKGVTSHE